MDREQVHPPAPCLGKQPGQQLPAWAGPHGADARGANHATEARPPGGVLSLDDPGVNLSFSLAIEF